MKKIRNESYDKNIIGVYRNRNFYYEYTNGYLYIIGIVQQGDTAKIKYYLYEERGRVHTKKIYGMDNEPYFMHNGTRVHFCDCDKVKIEGNSLLQWCGESLNLWDYIK